MAITQQFENGTGSQTQYTLLFPYVAAEDVKVTIGGVLQDQDDPTEGYEIDGEILTFLTAPPAGTDNIRIYRETDVESLRATFFAGSQLKAEDLNLNFNQTNYKNQETDNLVSDKWSKETATVYSTDAWDSDDDVVATTEAIDNRIDSKVDSALTTDVVAGDGLTITDNSPASGQITVGITNSGVTTAKIADSNVTTVKIADANITTAKIADSGVTTDKINNSAVTTAKIADSNVTTAKIADANVTTVKIADSNVTTAKIADGNVTTAKIADGNVTTIKVADSGITTDKIADSGVTTAKIADGNVTSSKVANSNITTEKIADSGITTAKIADSNVTTAKIADANVTTAKIADSAVTASKILDASISAEKLTDATIVTDAEQAASTPNDTSFFTTSAANTRFVNATGDTMSGVLNMGSNLISDVADPVTNSDAATKGWVASQIASGTVADATYGDIEVSNAGTTWELVAGAISNDDINSSADIDPSKIYGTAVTLIDTGTVTSTMIADGTIVGADIASDTIVDANIAASAEIAVSKLADGTARQLLQTDAAGTGVEWTSNVDIPGTLDVTSTATFDGVISASAGAAATPSVTFTGDTNTGIYSPGADQVAISTNGTGRLFVDANGNVGIGGTPASGRSFHVQGTGFQEILIEKTDATTSAVLLAADSGLAGIYTRTTAADSTAIPLAFHTGNTERVRIDSSGRLLVGTSSARTDFYNGISAATAQIEGTTFASATASITRNSNDNNSGAFFFAKSRGTANGGVTAVSANDNLGEIAWHGADGGTMVRAARIMGEVDGTPGANDMPGRLVFSTTADGAANPTEAMRIDSSGRVGIGTTSPTGTLNVHTTGTTDVSKELCRWSTASGGILGVLVDETQANPTWRLRYATNESLAFVANTTEHARIDSSGRLLVGTSTAPTANTGLDPKFVVSGNLTNPVSGGSITLARGSTATVGGQNLGALFFTDSEAGYFASIRCEADTSAGSNNYPGRLIFSTTAAGASTPTEQVTIDRNGNVGIGRYPTEALDVYRASGRCVVEADSDSLADGDIAGFSYVGGNRAGFIGIYKHAGITNPCSYVGYECEDGVQNYTWTDNSNVLRISTTVTHIGTTSGTVVGTQTSDERIKNILGPVEYGLDTLKQIEAVRYSLKSEPETEKIGFIAQQVQPLVPESVYDTNDHIEGEPEGAPTMLAMEYVALVPVLVNAVKELSAEVDALKAQLQTSNPN